MAKIKFEYIWLDGYKPEPMLRSKTKMLKLKSYEGTLDELPMWSFDGSSTQQAEGHSSDCLLKPVRVYPDPGRKKAYLVMCEVLNPDGTPHPTNHRANLIDGEDVWFGFEQEYVLMKDGMPYGFPEKGYPAPQGPYYCSVGMGNVAGRKLVEEHFDQCLDAGLDITGINAEVLLGQWEFQCFSKGVKKAADDLWIARYLLYRISEEYDLKVDISPKPIKGDWNGSGLHTNFSTAEMREKGGKDLFINICESFKPRHAMHIEAYGSDNSQRLTGLHETQSIEKFSYGVSDRGSSIRIPISVVEKNWIGYLEDRRPSANANPYRIVEMIIGALESISVEV